MRFGFTGSVVMFQQAAPRRNVEAEVKVKEPVVSNVPSMVPPTNETLSCFTSAVCFSMTLCVIL